ncbi:hypothetical protein ASD40_03715 [Paenibacillus sp. Root444D2]|nr:hypothetical protein ASD40_03715 [Paenibacillus sp. Root444D2]
MIVDKTVMMRIGFLVICVPPFYLHLRFWYLLVSASASLFILKALPTFVNKTISTELYFSRDFLQKQKKPCHIKVFLRVENDKEVEIREE